MLDKISKVVFGAFLVAGTTSGYAEGEIKEVDMRLDQVYHVKSGGTDCEIKFNYDKMSNTVVFIDSPDVKSCGVTSISCQPLDAHKQELLDYSKHPIDQKDQHCRLNELAPNVIKPSDIHYVSYTLISKGKNITVLNVKIK